MLDELTAHHEASGKVREMYRFGDRLLIVASDRISAYDVVLPTPIPDKGRVLTGLSAFWFERSRDIVANHLLSVDQDEFPEPARARGELAGRAMLVRRLTMLPLECVVRGYLDGSGWRDYAEHGAVAGHRLPPGLEQGSRLERPLFTPATKAASGHDVTIDRAAGEALVGAERFAELERLSLELYEHGAAHAAAQGIVLADTKFEFGLAEDGGIVLADEAMTPDSSRFWPADGHRPGGPQPSFDKQYVRDWLDGLTWPRTPPGPDIPPEVVLGTRGRYVEAYERLTGEPFADYLVRSGAGSAQ